jgi:hypothetical protein
MSTSFAALTARSLDPVLRSCHGVLQRRCNVAATASAKLDVRCPDEGRRREGGTKMTRVATGTAGERPVPVRYEIEGRLLEVCSCNVLCPCWVGEDPDGGTCDSSLAWRVDRGTIEGVDVSGLALALSVFIPGNVLHGNWRAAVYVDDRATPAQHDALLKVFTGQLGGAIADLAGLIGEVVSVERAVVRFDVDGGSGTLRIGDDVEARLTPFVGATGMASALHDTVFSTIPGSPVYVGKAETYRRDGRRHGMRDVAIEGRNALQGHFRFSA